MKLQCFFKTNSGFLEIRLFKRNIAETLSAVRFAQNISNAAVQQRSFV